MLQKMYNFFEVGTLHLSIKEKDKMKGKKKRVLPGFGLSLGFTSLVSKFISINSTVNGFYSNLTARMGRIY